MDKIKNPFVVGTYISPEYFCDRDTETKTLLKHIENGRNVSLSAPRRIGKTGLIHHFFNKNEVKNGYLTFFIDLYSTNSLAEMVQQLAVEIYKRLQPTSDRWWERFATVVSSLNAGFSMDPQTGAPSFSIGLGQIHSPEVSLDQIFNYLETSDSPCIVAIDEFQQIANYEEKNVEALLRTKIQNCHNTHFIFAGSVRHMMAQMFNSPSRPFYQSCIQMSLEPLPMNVYTDFCQHLFSKNNKQIERNVIEKVYHEFEGTTWYMHMMLNEMYALTSHGETCTETFYHDALKTVILSQHQAYQELLNMMPPKQKMVLEAIALEGKATGITSSAFIKKHSLPSTSSVQAAVKGLLEKQLIVQSDGTYWIYDYFFARYLSLRQSM